MAIAAPDASTFAIEMMMIATYFGSGTAIATATTTAIVTATA
jgi:hypothetical protein